jgi:type II secretory pathway pseudopilin PulG
MTDSRQRQMVGDPKCGRRPRGGFTMTEILIVIGIIVLLLGMAVPAFNAMRGSRSTEAAENQLNAMMARARTEAIGYQRTSGLFFFIDPRNPDRVSCAAVRQVAVPASLTNLPSEVYLDLVPERDFLILPPNIAVQLFDDCRLQPNSLVRSDDGYIGYNTRLSTPTQPFTSNTPFGGVILFDSNGRLVCQTYGFAIRPDNGNGAPAPGAVTGMGDLLFFSPNAYQNPLRPNVPGELLLDPGVSSLTDDRTPRSQFGLVLYDSEAFHGKGFSDSDPQLDNQGPTAGELSEETWLDQNATPLLANRYNGTLSRGQ